MKKPFTLLTLSMLFCASFSFSQNLVPNWDFEAHTGCPVSLNDLTVHDWFQPTAGTPDYFHVCGSNQAHIPSNFTGYQLPLSGDGYMGMICYNQDTLWREYISIALTDTLVASKCYEFEMFVNLNKISQFAMTELGAYFSNSPLSGATPAPLTVIPQVVHSGAVISDTAGWTSISGSFTAVGGETHITIGNFNGDSATTHQLVYPTAFNPYAYYFVENISLTACNQVGSEEEIAFNMNVSPNPFSESVTFSSGVEDTYILVVYDMTMQVVALYDFTHSIELDTEKYASGMYFYEVSNREKVIKTGKLLKQ